MNAKRFYFVMIAVVSLLGIGLIGSAYFGNSLLQKQSHKLIEQKLESKIKDEQQTDLIKAKKDIEKYTELVQEAKAIVPQDKDQAQAVREIVKIAKTSGINLGSITFPSSTLGQSSGVSVPGATASAVKSPPVTQVQSVVGIKGLYVMPITIQSDTNSKTTYGSLIKFLSQLEQNRRTAQVAGVTITPDKQSPSALQFNLVVNVYIKP